ncbi:MAG: hypothetical protein OJF48_002198 [Afipia sp.]|nr:MAG: hypothetical protein OJF48_002198 [Afipia sp.]
MGLQGGRCENQRERSDCKGFHWAGKNLEQGCDAEAALRAAP